MSTAGAALVILGIVIWGLIVSRTFRIVAAIGACGIVAWLMYLSDQGDKEQRVRSAQNLADQAELQKRQQQLWAMIRPDQVQIRDLNFARQRDTSEFILSGAVKNLSNQKLGAVEFEITARDCLRECETIGHADHVMVWVDVPPQEVRGLPAHTVEFAQMPEIKGKFVPQILITRIYSGDILDQWSAR